MIGTISAIATLRVSVVIEFATVVLEAKVGKKTLELAKLYTIKVRSYIEAETVA